MAYGYFKNNHHLDDSCFEIFFRKNPFKGEYNNKLVERYTIFCGLYDVLNFMKSFKIQPDQIEFLKYFQKISTGKHWVLKILLFMNSCQIWT